MQFFVVAVNQEMISTGLGFTLNQLCLGATVVLNSLPQKHLLYVVVQCLTTLLTIWALPFWVFAFSAKMAREACKGLGLAESVPGVWERRESIEQKKKESGEVFRIHAFKRARVGEKERERDF